MLRCHVICANSDQGSVQERRPAWPSVSEISQFADTKISKVLFPGNNSEKLLLLGKSTGRNLALWKKVEDWITDPFRAVSTASVKVDPVNACLVKNDLVAVSFVDGSISFVSTKDDVVSIEKSLKTVHDGSEARVVSLYNNTNILSGSSNGSLGLIDIEKGVSNKIFSGQGGVRSMCSVPSSQIVYTGHVTGQIAKWDLREKNESLLTTADVMVPSQKPLVPITSLCVHPAQPNIICYGDGDGVVGVIHEKSEERIQVYGSYIVTESEITQVAFHPTSNDNLLVTTKGGAFLRLDASAAPINTNQRGGRSNVWLGGGDLASALRVEPLRGNASFDLNSFDCCGDTLVASSSIGSVYIYENLPFFPVS